MAVPGWLSRWAFPPARPYGVRRAALSKEQERDLLRKDAEWLKQQMDAVDKRLEELAKE
jgi:hypothetical protein